MDPTINKRVNESTRAFSTLSDGVGRFSVRDKILLLPEMSRRGNYLIAGTFRSFGVNARVIDTYKGMDLGKQFTSGKECYPCQVTTGDILYALKDEKEKLGEGFHPEDYVVFMPTAEGPCRFGMYNKYQRIILDSFLDFKDVKIATSNARDAYALDGMLEKAQERDLRIVGYFALVVGDILDRLLWRVRPYEKEEGITDDYVERSMHDMAASFERYGARKNFDRILDHLEEIIEEGKSIIDPSIPPKPLIGIVGEIYLRSHVQSNQDIIRVLEKYGGEVINASIAEWFNYTTYDKLRDLKRRLTLSLKQFHFGRTKTYLKEMIKHGGELWYQQRKQDQVYDRAKKVMPLAGDHRVGHLEKILEEDDLFSFEVGTETCLSIPGILAYAKEGYNGVVNVYPFTCMPSTITSAIVRPIMNRMKVPYLDSAYDGTFQPGREAAIRTFMYQAKQHFERNGRIDLEKQ
jgi:predicted nucleotide-binding protein (sugar kinase/HSP70/actin superfamily)